MVAAIANVRRFRDALETHGRIIWALLMRELSTRYGRNDLGFFWVVAEPMIFAGAVASLWSVIRPPFESGIRVVPFTITGYMPLIMIRQSVGFVVGAVKVNNQLLFHKQITPLHLFIGRVLVEFAGISLAYVIIVLSLNIFGIMPLPIDLLKVIAGWFLLGWMTFGLAMIMGALSELFDFVERFVQVITYILIPISGAFFMASSLPGQFRHWVLFVPFIHCFELMRGGYFGEFVTAYYNIPYAAAWAAGMNLLGLALIQFVRERVDVE